MRALWWIGLAILLLAGAPTAQATDTFSMSADDFKALQLRLTDDGCYRGAIDGQPTTALQVAIKTCPSQDPILRIETGMHVAPINRIGVDRACRIAATGSLDKTVRVWSLPDGHLLRTLRVPIGPGHGGKIFATAVSPDGRWIAVGGWDAQWDVDRTHFVYIFDAATGTLVARVGPIGNVISYLAFSPDGHWLAATSAAGVGLKVIDTQTWRVKADDRTYRGPSYGAAFGPDGHLYTVADDGKLRRYGPVQPFRKERQVATRGGKQPSSVAVDPSGQLLAVGFYNSTRIDIYDAATLRFRFAADTNGVNGGDLGEVAWSSDGKRLVAGGRYAMQIQGGWKYSVLTFGRDGQRIGSPLPLSNNTITDVQPCGAGLAVAAADPAFGLVDGNEHTKFWKTGVAPDMRNKLGDAFTIAPNAQKVRFGLGYGGSKPILFDLAQATLTPAPKPLPGFLAPATKGLPVEGWDSGLAPTFAKKPLQLILDDASRSLAIRADQSGFVLGTNFKLAAYDARGQQLWEQPGPSNTWGVDLSADGRIIVAAYGDGTIRWHRWSDGQELLALFVDKTDKRWVAWTPTGYYMASPGGEDLIGWHVNRGWNQAADFFPASRFRARFNRPDIVRLVLDTLDEDKAIQQANLQANRREDTQPLIAHLPPIIRIVDPADGTHVTTGTVTLDYSFRSPSGLPVDRIDVQVNGRPVKEIGLPIHALSGDTETKGSVSLTLAQHDSDVGLIAFSGDLSSEAARLKLIWDGAPATTAQERKLYALVVGVGAYADPTMVLPYAAKDAKDFAQALQDQKGLYYGDVETRVITDRAVTRESLIEGLEWLEKNATDPNDVSVLFLAGHGLTDAKQTYWFFPADANADTIRAKGVSQDEIRQSLQSLKGKVLWFLDTCHAGSAAKRPPVDMNVLLNTVTSAENGGIIVFASSTGQEVSVESSALGNGAFTKALVEGIENGKAAFPGDLVTTSGLDTFVENRVQELTNKTQNPVMERPPQEPDFAIAQVHK